MRSAAALLAASLLGLLAACGGNPPAVPQPATPELATISVATGAEAGGVAWDGVVQAVEQAVISAQTGGRITALNADVDQHVAAGAVLLRITSEEQSAAVQMARAQVKAAEAQQADAKNRFERASELIGRQLISRDDFDRVKAANDAAAAAVDAARALQAQAGQQLAYTTVRAPYAATIAARSVELGEAVAPGRPLFTLYSPGALRVEVQVPQSDAQAIRAKPAATVTLADGREVQAARVIVFPSADPQAHSNAVRVMLPQSPQAMPAQVRPGQTAKVRFAAAAGPAGIWLPMSVVVTRGELSGAYVVGTDSVVLRQLRLGSRQGERIEVLSGLAAGERVATDPVAALAWLRAHRDGKR
ncbi:MAG: efflux RND transporter periplasmic adaptor subunit [Steroidobacteraceae bacterium]